MALGSPRRSILFSLGPMLGLALVVAASCTGGSSSEDAPVAAGSAAPGGDAPRTSPGEGVRLLGGEMIYLADAARFTECTSGTSLPIAMEGAFPALQRAYLERVSAPGAPLYVTFVGAIAERPGMEEGSGSQPTVVVHDFVEVWPSQSCERARTDAPLVDTTWGIRRLGDQPVRAAEGGREPSLLLHEAEGEPRYAATAGCNQLVGSYVLDGDRLSFRGGATSLMACPPPLDDLERRLGDVLLQTAHWRIAGNTLVLEDEARTRIALLEAAPR